MVAVVSGNLSLEIICSVHLFGLHRNPLFISGLFNNAVYSSDCTLSNGTMINE
jgi:hypothetical protein